MTSPARYRIRVQGHLAPDASACLRGLSIRSNSAGDGETASTLEGVLADQAALAGVLHTLYARQLPVLRVEFLHPRHATWEILADQRNSDREGI